MTPKEQDRFSMHFSPFVIFVCFVVKNSCDQLMITTLACRNGTDDANLLPLLCDLRDLCEKMP